MINNQTDLNSDQTSQVDSAIVRIKEVLKTDIDDLKNHLSSHNMKAEDLQEKLPSINIIVKDQTVFNVNLVKKVHDYLVEAWKMSKEGKTQEECKAFMENKRLELAREHEQKLAEIKRNINQLFTEA